MGQIWEARRIGREGRGGDEGEASGEGVGGGREEQCVGVGGSWVPSPISLLNLG